MSEKIERHTMAVLVENEPGVHQDCEPIVSDVQRAPKALAVRRSRQILLGQEDEMLVQKMRQFAK